MPRSFLSVSHLPRNIEMSIDTSKIIEENKRGANDTGSPEVQVALMLSLIHI